MFGRLKADKTHSRSIDGMRNLGMHGDGAMILDAGALPWKNNALVGAGDHVDQRVEQEQLQAEREQSRIINFFSADKAVVVSAEEIVNLGSRSLRELKRERANDLRRLALEETEPVSTPEQRELFLERVVKGEITVQDETNFLLLIRSPLKMPDIGPERMFEHIASDPRQKQILAVAVGLNALNWQRVDQDAMVRILSSVQANGDDYRTPVGFASLREHFLSGIRPKASEQVYRRYVQSMDELEKLLYGQRMNYYKQFEALRREIVHLADHSVVVQQTRPRATVQYTHKGFELVTAERCSEVLGKVIIDGDTWKSGQLEQHLGTHSIAEANLGPHYETQLDRDKIYLSEMFQLPGGYLGALGFVEQDGRIKARSFYRHSSEVLWCYLPDYIRRSGGGIERYCTGYGEKTVLLPTELQEVLMQIEMATRPRNLTNEVTSGGSYFEPEFYLAGTAYGYDSLQEYQSLWSYGHLKGDYYQEVSRDPLNHDMGVSDLGHKKAPYTLSIDHSRSPNFNHKIAEFEVMVADLGNVRVEGFRSWDDQYNWLFARDMRERAWIENVEVLSPLTSTGLRRDFVMMGDLTTALYEHTNQAGSYGDRNDTKGARQCMWHNYLSNVPLIKEYLQS